MTTAFAAAGLVACSGDDEGAPVTSTLDAGEGGAMPPPPAPDGSVVVDAGVADADAEAEAPRVCSDDGFCHTPLAASPNLTAVWADGAGAAWAVSEDGAVLRYDGVAWKTHTKMKGALLSVWGSGPNDVWIGGNEGLFHGTGATSATLAFVKVPAPGDTRAPVSSIWGTGAKDIWAVGSVFDSPYVARVLHYTDGFAGAGWQLDGSSSNPILMTRVFGTAASGVWIAGRRNNPITINPEVVLMRRAPSDTKFVEIPLPKDPTSPPGSGHIDELADGAAGADNTIWVLGRTNTSRSGFAKGVTTDGITYTWSFVVHGPSVGPRSRFVGGTGKNDHWVGGAYGRFHHWDGTSWLQGKTTITKYPEITDLNAMWWNTTGEIWVVGDGIAFHKTPKKN